jgi:PAS domain S-box-containing protein
MSPSGTQALRPGAPPGLPAWLKVALALIVWHMAWHLMAFPRTPLVQLYDRSFLAVVYGVVAWRLFRAARRQDFPLRLRQGLAWLAAGNAIGSGATVYLLTDRYLHPAASSIYSGADALFLTLYPVMLTGLVLLPRGERTAVAPWRILIDGVVFLVGLGVPLWMFAIRPDLQHATGIDAVLVVVWPSLAFAAVLMVNTALLTRAPVPTPRALWLLLSGLGVLWFSDLVFTLDAAAGLISRSPVNWINFTNTLALGLCLFAAWRYESDPMPASEPPRPAPFSPVPMVTIVVITVWLVLSSMLKPGSIPLELVLPSLSVLFVILFVRETLVMGDSLHWAAAEAQRESRIRFEALVRNSSDIIMIVDRKWHIRFASPAATRALGQTPEALLARSFDELIHPDYAAAGQQFFGRMTAQPGATNFVDLRLRHGNGSYRNFETTGANLLDEAAIGGYVLNLRDVSERMQLEERLRHAEKMEAVGRLAGGVAHDFNNLLAVILANSDLALMDAPEGGHGRRELEEIRRAAKRGAALTGRLLAFGRRENSAPSILSPSELLHSLRPVLQTMTGPNLSLQIRTPVKGGHVRINPDGLEQAVLNLVANARDAMAERGQLTLAVEEAELYTALDTPYLVAPPGRYVVLKAQDDGMGMEESTRARLFEPFFTTKARGKGTGLGLASIYAMVKQAGGGILVESAPGRGTTISLWLPRVEEAPDPAGGSSHPFTGPGAGNILLVEDQAAVRDATERMLLLKGYSVLSACDADDARRKLQNHAGPLHLLLTDVIMPGQSGPALAAALVKERRDLRVLFMSGYTGQELAAQGLDDTRARLLVKPFTLAELTSRVSEAIQGPPGLA